MNFDVHYDESKTRHNQRQIILQRAYRLFIDKGIQNVTMQDIAEASSIQRRTLYYYYNNKEAVAIELLNCVLSEFKGIMLNIPSYFTTAYARIEYMLHFILEYMLNNEDVVLFTVQSDYFFQKSYGDSGDKANVLAAYVPLGSMLEAELQRGVEDGSIKAKFADNMMDVMFVAGSSIFSLAQRILYREGIIKQESGYDRKSITLLVDILLSGLKAEEQQS